jgi:hypothetical protein
MGVGGPTLVCAGTGSLIEVSQRRASDYPVPYLCLTRLVRAEKAANLSSATAVASANSAAIGITRMPAALMAPASTAGEVIFRAAPQPNYA